MEEKFKYNTIEEGWQLDEVEYKLLGQDLLITGKIKEA